MSKSSNPAPSTSIASSQSSTRSSPHARKRTRTSNPTSHNLLRKILRRFYSTHDFPFPIPPLLLSPSSTPSLFFNKNPPASPPSRPPRNAAAPTTHAHTPARFLAHPRPHGVYGARDLATPSNNYMQMRSGGRHEYCMPQEGGAISWSF